MTELNRVETVAIALNVGISYPWAENHVLAHGLAGQRNPLGNALTHLLSHPNGINARLVTNLLAIQLVKEKRVLDSESWDVADKALTYWHDARCRPCNGTGVQNIQQDVCPFCKGVGKTPEPKDEKVKQALAVINFHLEWMDGMLRKKLGKGHSA